MLEGGYDWFNPTLAAIESRATRCDLEGCWPEEDIADLAALGAMKWAVPAQFGGDDLPPLLLHERYEYLAEASMATALAFTQRDAAIGFIEISKNDPLRERLLPKLARNELWTTIGISHLTTSKLAGALSAHHVDGGLVLNGVIPWSTGAAQSDFVVAGAKVQNGDPVIFALPTDRAGVTVREPQRLAALAAAHTSSIECRDVKIESELLLSGPSSDAMTARTRSVHISQAFAALGLIRAALGLIRAIRGESADTTFKTLYQQFEELRHATLAANEKADGHDKQTGPLLRSELNNLALRATHAAITLHKGRGLRLDHPAQRLAREAMFLLVWSSPSAVVDRNLELMSTPL